MLKTSVKTISKSSCLEQGVICCPSGRLRFLCAGAVLGACHRRHSRAIRKVLFNTSVKIVSKSIFCSKGLTLQIVPNRIFEFSAGSSPRRESKWPPNDFRKGLIRLGRVENGHRIQSSALEGGPRGLRMIFDPIKCSPSGPKGLQMLFKVSRRVSDNLEFTVLKCFYL